MGWINEMTKNAKKSRDTATLRKDNKKSQQFLKIPESAG